MSDTPKYESRSFACIHCSVVSSQRWLTSDNLADIVAFNLNHEYLDYRGKLQDYQQSALKKFIESCTPPLQQKLYHYFPRNISISICTSCNCGTIWYDQKVVYPNKSIIPNPNPDLSPEIIAIYNEASSILNLSPKGSAALLRLAFQKFLIQIGRKGSKINDDIKELVAEGLSSEVQKALDLLRVIGNNAVHPGQINLDDNKEIAQSLFSILNFLADELITKPKTITSLYEDLIPETTKEHIEQRDQKPGT
jgi:hypothetical protein